jgi:DNA-binding CsgD family transcriptional regulator
LHELWTIVNETAQVSQLIGEIYDAALDRSLWPAVLEETCAFVHGACAAIVAQSPVAATGQFYFSWGLDPHYEQLYLQEYIKLNTAAAMAMFAKVGEVICTDLLMPYDEYLASRFHLEWAQPQGYCDFVGTLLEKSVTSFANVAVVRHERHGRADHEARRRMGLLAPHFQRAVAFSKLIDLSKLEAAALADALDVVAAAMFLVDAQARVVHANSSGQVLLAKGDVVVRRGEQLAAIDPNAEQTLHQVFAAAAAGDRAVGVKGIAMPLDGEDGERWVAHVLPLTSGARRRAGASYAAVAAVFVSRATLDLVHPIETVANLYRLTPAEMRVLTAVLQIGSVPDVAPVLGISETTVKTHLQRVFEKTGTKRQADLVKLVAGFMSPATGTA